MRAKGLRAARDLISDPDRWTTGQLARNSLGEPVLSFSNDAVCWCAHGALRKCSVTDDEGCALDNAARSLYHRGVIAVNDTLGHEAVLRMFDRGIEFYENDITTYEELG